MFAAAVAISSRISASHAALAPASSAVTVIFTQAPPGDLYRFTWAGEPDHLSRLPPRQEKYPRGPGYSCGSGTVPPHSLAAVVVVKEGQAAAALKVEEPAYVAAKTAVHSPGKKKCFGHYRTCGPSGHRFERQLALQVPLFG